MHQEWPNVAPIQILAAPKLADHNIVMYLLCICHGRYKPVAVLNFVYMHIVGSPCSSTFT